MAGWRKANKSKNERLYPSQFSSRFYHLTLLREAMKSIADKHLSKKEKLTLVDYGCGTMPYRPIFEKYVEKYVGVDLPGNPEADFYVGNDGRTPLPSEFADIILSTQVLHHVPEPVEYLKECYRLLKPGGLLILSTHGYWKFAPHPTDFWRWTNDGLKRIIKGAGFEIIDFRGLMGLASTALQLLQDALIPKIPGFIKPVFAFLMQRLVMVVDKLESSSSKSQDACVFVVVAKRTR